MYKNMSLGFWNDTYIKQFEYTRMILEITFFDLFEGRFQSKSSKLWFSRNHVMTPNHKLHEIGFEVQRKTRENDAGSKAGRIEWIRYI